MNTIHSRAGATKPAIGGTPSKRAHSLHGSWRRRRAVIRTGAKPMRGRIVPQLTEASSTHSNIECCPPHGGAAPSSAVTWLILPVVICLSQRLSHACLSISIIPRNCRRLIKTVMVYLMVHCYLDNRSNSRANTCTKERLTKLCIY